VDNYFKDTLRAGPSKVEKAPKIPRAPKQIAMYAITSVLIVFFPKPLAAKISIFPHELAELRVRDTAVYKRLKGICAVAREDQRLLMSSWKKHSLSRRS
jgi:SWI/SNF-related matrix-associated actin-dependent regulator of chromatin subfamily A member 5